MISRQKKFIFVHIPKTGGSSIQTILKDYSEDVLTLEKPHHDGFNQFQVRNPDLPVTKHAPLRKYRRLLGDATFHEYFKFACVRNPWDRLISSYFSPEKGNHSWNRSAFVKFLNTRKPLAHYLDSRDTPKWLSRFIRTRVDVDFVLRFENLTQDFAALCDKLGIPRQQLPHRNKSQHKQYTNYYNAELIELVAHRFAWEIEHFGYTFGELQDSSPHEVTHSTVTRGS